MPSKSFSKHLVATLISTAVIVLRPVEPVGMLEQAVTSAQESLQALWGRARGDTERVVRGLARGFHRQESDVLQAATEQLDHLGLDLDLSEAGDEVNEDVYACVKATQAEYGRQLALLRRRVQRCWGWEASEVAALIRSLEDLLYAGDRLPDLLRVNMDQCLHTGHTTTDTPPSPFRVLRCTADSVNVTWAYVSSVPREVGRAARRAAGLLGSSREDWLGCARSTVQHAASPALRALRDLALCVADKVSEQSWQRLHRAWQQPR